MAIIVKDEKKNENSTSRTQRYFSSFTTIHTLPHTTNKFSIKPEFLRIRMNSFAREFIHWDSQDKWIRKW